MKGECLFGFAIRDTMAYFLTPISLLFVIAKGKKDIYSNTLPQFFDTINRQLAILSNEFGASSGKGEYLLRDVNRTDPANGHVVFSHRQHCL